MIWDTDDLIARFARQGRLPETRTYPTDTDICAWLSEAEALVLSEIAAHVPRALMGPPVLMQTDDGGYTYFFGRDGEQRKIFPMGHAEVYAKNGSRELYSSTYVAGDGDVVFEGDHIRMPRARAGTYSSGPYARFVTVPGELSSGVDSAIKPAHARMLLVYRALALYAAAGGLRDETPYQDKYDRAWSGNPRTGEVGLLGMYQTQFRRQTTGGLAGAGWWRAVVESGYPFGVYDADGVWDGSTIFDI